MENKAFFELKDEHFELLSQLNIRGDFYPCSELGVYPAIDIKRLFGNSSTWEDVAEILKIKPERTYTEDDIYTGKDIEEGYPYGYSPKQVLECKLWIVELIPAIDIIFKKRTFTTGLHEIEPYGTYYNYQHARNYILLHSFIREIEKKYNKEISVLHDIAMNISGIDDSKVYEKFYKKLDFKNTKNMKNMKKYSIDWLDYTLDELRKKITMK